MLASPPTRALTCRMAASAEDILAVQRLRYSVFVTECGASGEGVDHVSRREADHFDAFADHLLLLDLERPAEDQIVGTYRLMTRDHAKQAGGFYSAHEFDLTALTDHPGNLLELGRSCLHPDYRGGTGLLELWQSIGRYVAAHDIDIMFGVASFPGTDREAIAGPLSLLHASYLAPERLRVRTKGPTAATLNRKAPDTQDRRAAMMEMPQLIKAYLRLGGVVGDGAFVDKAFNTTDVCMILEASRMSARQRALYGGAASDGG